MSLNPIPFRLKVPGRDAVEWGGIESVSYRVDGLLRLADKSVILEWTGTRTTQEVSFDKIGTDVDELPPQWLELPFGRIAGAWVVGGWWWPRLELRARGLEDFIGVPATHGVTLRLRIHRRDRGLARTIVFEIERRVAATLLAYENRPQLGAAGLPPPYFPP
jgi:hypothetical protein